MDLGLINICHYYLVNTYGVIVEVIMVNGNKEKCMVQVNLNGQMGDSTMDNILMIRRKDKEHLYGVKIINHINSR
jgi:hypothetical protein